MSVEASAAVVRAARAGSEQAWAELHQRHARRLVVWLASLPRGDSASSPEDLAAEAWLTAAQKINYYSGTDDDFGGWLFAIARYLASNQSRRAGRRRTDPLAYEAGSEATWVGHVEDHSDTVDAQQDTRALLAQLSPRQAEVVALVDVVGLDTATAAAVLDITPTAVRVTRHRALGRLRAILADPQLSSGTPSVAPAATTSTAT